MEVSPWQAKMGSYIEVEVLRLVNKRHVELTHQAYACFSTIAVIDALEDVGSGLCISFRTTGAARNTWRYVDRLGAEVSNGSSPRVT